MTKIDTEPYTPVSRTLRRAPMSYSATSLKNLYERSFSRFRNNRTCEVWVYNGPPGSGKSTVIGEQLAKLRYDVRRSLKRKVPTESLRRMIHYVPFEGAQKAAMSFGLIPQDRIPGTQTTEDYHHATSVFEKAISRVIAPGKFVVIEAPGTIGRGTAALHDLALRRGRFKDLHYRLSWEYLTGGSDIRSRSDLVRSDLEKLEKKLTTEAFANQVKMMQDHGIRVHASKTGEAQVSGAYPLAMATFEKQENDFLQGLIDNKLISPYITLPDRRLLFINPEWLYVPAIKAMFLTQRFSEYFYGKGFLSVPPRHVFVAINRSCFFPQLYQNYIDFHNDIRQLVDRGRLQDLYPH